MNVFTVPASLLPQIKQALIKLGYAEESTPLSSIQDAYYKYVMVRQTSTMTNTNIPYAIGLLPKNILDGIESDTGGGDGGSAGGLVNLRMPSVQAMKSLYQDIRSGLWASALNPALGLGTVPLANVNDFEFNLVDSQIQITPINVGAFNVTESGMTAVGASFVSLLEVENVTDSQIASMIDGTTGIDLYQLTGDTPTQYPNEYYPLLLSQHPVSKKYYVVFPTTVIFKNENYLKSSLLLDSKGDGVDIEDLAVSIDFIGNPTFKPPSRDLTPLRLKNLTPAETLAVHTELYNGTIAMPSSLGIASTDLLEPSKINFVIGKEVIEHPVPNRTDSTTKVIYGAVVDPEYVGEIADYRIQLAAGKKLLTFTKIDGLNDALPNRSLVDFIKGQANQGLNSRNLDPFNANPASITLNPSATQGAVDQLRGNFIQHPVHGVLYCRVVDAIGTPSQKILYTSMSNGVSAGGFTADVIPVGYYRGSRGWEWEGATEINRKVSYTSGNKILDSLGAEVDGLVGIHTLVNGELASLDLTPMFDTTDSTLGYTLKVGLAPTATTLDDLLDPNSLTLKELVSIRREVGNPDLQMMVLEREVSNGASEINQTKIFVFRTISDTEDYYPLDEYSLEVIYKGSSWSHEGVLSSEDFTLADNTKLVMWIEFDSRDVSKVSDLSFDVTPIVSTKN